MGRDDTGRIVVVLGMHRSGTSLLARIARAFGVELGTDLIAATDANPEGFWEHAGIVRLHDEILEAIGRSFNRPEHALPFPAGWWRDPRPQAAKARLIEIVRGERAQTPGLWGFKDPRTARLLPLWHEIFEELALEPVYLLTVRHPAAVAASYMAWNPGSRAGAELLWLVHNLEAVHHAGDRLRVVVDYDRWFTHPAEQLQAVLAALGAPAPADPGEALRTLREILRPQLRRHRAATQDVVLPLIADAYAQLCRVAATGTVTEELLGIEGLTMQAQALLADWQATIDEQRVTIARQARELDAARRIAVGASAATVPSFSGLPADGHGPQRRLRVCIATPEVIGPYRNGGIGTAYTTLAEALAAAGHDVTLLYLAGEHCEDRSLDFWTAAYAEKGIRFVPLPGDVGPPLRGPATAVTPYRTYLWLRERAYDVIHFPEYCGPGYYCMLAKRQGLAFADTLLCVGTHGPNMWIKQANSVYVQQVRDLELDFLERQSVALADVVVSPSRYLLDWMHAHGWELPERCYVHQNILPRDARAHPANDAQALREIVFFGRLETRKGLELFCDALDLLAASDPPAVTVTFLGKRCVVNGQDGGEYVRRRSRSWPWRIEMLSDLDQPQAVRYLGEGGRLAVIPSLLENSPYTVLECAGAGIPFVTTRVGGIPELIAAEDLARVCCPAWAPALAELLGRAVRDGIRPVRPAVDPAVGERRWVAWHEAHGVEPEPRALTPTVDPDPARLPLVSICLVTFNRPALLRQALASIEAQDYPNLEVVLVDDGSTDPDAVALLDALKPGFAQRGWQIVRQENRYLGAARNTGARHARGAFLLFQDDDNCAKPDEISRLVAVARASNADIVTCCQDFFTGAAAPDAGAAPLFRWLYLGGAASLGAFYNCFGDANALLRRDVFDAVGGFTEDYGVGFEDWEFFAKAVLMGFRLTVMPDAPYWYRASADSMIHVTKEYTNHMRAIRPYVDAVPGALRALPLLAQGARLRSEGLESMLLQERERGRTAPAAEPSDWEALLRAAKVLGEAGELPTARELVTRAVELARRTDVPAQMSAALCGAGTLLQGLAQRAEALDAFVNAIEVAEGIDDLTLVIPALVGSGGVLADLGEKQTAKSTLLRALDLALQTKEPPVIFESMLEIGDVLHRLGETDTAQHILLTARNVAREQLGDAAMERADARLRRHDEAPAAGLSLT